MKRFLPFFIICLSLTGFIWAQEDASAGREAFLELYSRAEQGDAKALYQLAKLYDIGYDTIAVDTVRSNFLYLQSALRGYAPAMNFIGFRYFNGEGIRQDLDSGLYWIRKAAEAGDITAAANLGYLMAEGKGISQDKEKAVQWLTVAAEAGVIDAQMHLIAMQGDKWKYLPQDTVLKKGVEYYTGRAPFLGVKFLEIAAENGSPKAAALLGDAYSHGRGIRYDHQKSVEYFFEAAKGGDPSAQFILAELLDFFPDSLQGLADSDDPDSTTATFWRKKAKENGVANSETTYSLLYLSSPAASIDEGNEK